MPVTNPFVLCGQRLENRISVLMAQLVTDGEISTAPTVRLKKRRSPRGAREDLFMITQGITIIPVIQSPEGGVSSREDIAYRFLISLGYGSWSTEVPDDWPVATWAQAIQDRYQQSRIGVVLPNGCEIATTCTPTKMPDWAKLDDHIEATFFELAVWTRNSRRFDS